MKVYFKYFFYIMLFFFFVGCTEQKQQIRDSYLITTKVLDESTTYFENKISILEERNENDIFVASDSLLILIEKYETELLEIVGSIEGRDASSYNFVKSEKATEYFFSEDEKASLLKNKLEEYTSFLISVGDNNEFNFKIKNRLSTKDRNTEFWGDISWESWMFESLPLITCVQNLKLIKLQVLMSEYETITMVCDE